MSVPWSHSILPVSSKSTKKNIVGGGFNSVRERFRNGPKLTNWCIFYELPRESKIKLVQTKTAQ